MKDNYGLFLEHEAEMEKKLMKMPICACCKEHIQGEYRYRIGDKLYCQDCVVKEENEVEE